MRIFKNPEFLLSQAFFLVFAIVSFLLRHRGLSFFDTSDFATAIQGTAIPHAPGYPLYVLLGKFFFNFTQDPFDAQFWVNIFAAWFTCIFLFLSLSAKKSAAFVIVLFLLAQSLFQQYILIPEVFTLNLTLASVLIFCHQQFEQTLKNKYVFFIGLMYGLAFCHHHLMALMVPASAYLLFRGLKKTNWLTGGTLALGGFAFGLLPLIYLFVSTAKSPEYTYYSVTNIQELLFVVLRQGYGTFKMTGSAASVPAIEILSLTFFSMLKSTFVIGLIGGILAIPGYWRSQKPVKAEAVLTVTTLLVFIVLFCILANFPIGTLEGKNAFRRYLTFPCFLFLFPLSYGLEWLSQRLGRKVYFAGGLIALLAGTYSLTQLNYRHYTAIEFHVSQAFHSIQRVVGPQPDTNVDPKMNRCIIFALSDPFHFGGRYYNEFQTDYRCYFVSLSTVISGQFLGKSELALMRTILGTDYVIDGTKTREGIIFEFLNRAMQAGYRIFALYRYDLEIFRRPDMRISPVGNIVEYVPVDSVVTAEFLYNEYIGYLDSLKVYLNEVEGAPIQPQPLAKDSLEAPFINLNVYPQLVKTTPAIQKVAEEISRRADKILSKTN